jgi:hypothetical protein
MILKLVRTEETDGNWYKVIQDGETVACYTTDPPRGEEGAKKEALKKYQEHLTNATKLICTKYDDLKKTEVIKSTEI